MPLLVSFCNEKFAPSKSLLLLDETRPTNARWVDLHGALKEGGLGCAGIAHTPDHIYVLTQSPQGTSQLLVYDPEFRFLNCVSIESAIDAHSLTFLDSTLFVVSTGDNTIRALALSADHQRVIRESLFWRHPASTPNDGDVVHLNSICEVNGQFIVTCFGRRTEGTSWKNATNGMCQNVTTGEVLADGLQQPHTVKSLDGRLALCESGKARLLLSKVEGNRDLTDPVPLGGYVRGLDLCGDSYVVGCSASRTKSRRTGTQNMGNDIPSPHCAILLVDCRTETVHSVLLDAYGSELYDIVHLPHAIVNGRDALGERISDLENSVTHLTDELHECQQAYASVTNSRSFKLGFALTWPFRLFRDRSHRPLG